MCVGMQIAVVSKNLKLFADGKQPSAKVIIVHLLIVISIVHSCYTHLFNSPLSRTASSNLDFTEARDSEWQWHQLGHMQVCTSLQTDNHASTPPICFYRPDALPAAQPTASKH